MNVPQILATMESSDKDDTKNERPVHLVEREILEQPNVLEQLLKNARGAVEAAAARIRERAPSVFLIAARGSSDNAARYAQYLFGIRHGRVVALASPSMATLYGATLDVRSALVIGVSQSGQSPDILQVIESAQKHGALTLCISNDVQSPLAFASDLTLDIGAGVERAVAATKTYTAELFMFAMLSAALHADNSAWNALARVPEWVDAMLRWPGQTRACAQDMRQSEHWIILGRGYNYATACELALKIQEMAGLVTERFSSADFLHGPIAVVGPGFPVLLCAPTGKALAQFAAVLDELKKRGAHCVILSDDDAFGQRADHWLTLPKDIPEWLSPIVAVVAGQRLALELSRLRGLNPDHPLGLSKVTRTL